jgi:hypothetical protein
MNPRRVLLTLACLALCVAPRGAGAQSFGQNKVHYETLEWSVLETPHLRVHYYAQEESLARSLAAFAESVAVEYDGRFALRPRQRIPLLLYSTHHLFQQTNATPEMLSEGVGGLTELVKGRVLVPHTGSWARLRWVTRHEMAHAYMLAKLQHVLHAHHKPPGWFPPLWYTEGLAEYCGTTWDEDGEGLLRDMFVSRMAYPLMHSEPITGSVEMYKEGQSFLLWLAERYGEPRIFGLLENAWRSADFETDFRITYGRPLAEVDGEWFAAMQKRYYPALLTASRPADVARPFRQPSRFNLGPRALPAAAADSDTTVRLCWFEVNDGAVDLMVSEPSARGERRERRLLRSGGTPAFESFHLFDNRPAVSATGRVAVSAAHGGRDALYLIDAPSGKVVRRIEFPELVALHDPSIVPGDSAVVFAAQDYDGQADLYRVTWTRNESTLERLTHDSFDDVDPAVSPDGRWVAFASDRGEDGGRHALFRLPLAGGPVERLSWPARGDDRQPAWSPDGAWLAFRSTRGGTSDLWVRPSQACRQARRVTRLLGPASDPDWTRDGRGLLFTAQDAVTFHTYCVRFDPDTLATEPEFPRAAVATLPTLADTLPAQDYQRRLGLDLIQNAIGVSPSFNSTMGFGQIAMSDVLGNEQYVLTLANDSENFGDFWSGWEGGLTYFNQAQRLNYGLGAFRLTSLYDPDFEVLRRELRVGVLGLASYPFNRFDRVDASVEVRHASHHLLRNGGAPDVDLVSNYVSVVHDNSRWTWDGPVGGLRLNLTTGYTRDMSSGLSDYGTVLAEARHYRQPLPHVVLAMRANAQGSFGADAQYLYLGGPTRVHVREYRAITGHRAVVGNLEARFPLLRGLTIAVPAPWQLPTLSGVVYADGVRAWGNGDRQQLGVLGWAVYLGGGFWPAVRWNWSWTSADFERFDSAIAQHYISIAYNF